MVWELVSSKAYVWAPTMASVPCAGDVLLVCQDDEAVQFEQKQECRHPHGQVIGLHCEPHLSLHGTLVLVAAVVMVMVAMAMAM